MVLMFKKQADSQNHGWAEQYLQSIRKRATAVHPVGSQEAERLQKVIGIIERKLKKKLDVPIEIRSFEFDGYIGFGSFGKVWKVSFLLPIKYFNR